MEKTKKNNKGFSLVELIVVVLIMAIIAVALAPQVMKWVDKSRQATDVSNYDALISVAQLALVEGLPTADVTITMDETGAKADPAAFETQMNKVSADWKNTKAKVDGASYSFTVKKEGSIVRGTGTAAPAEVTTD